MTGGGRRDGEQEQRGGADRAHHAFILAVSSRGGGDMKQSLRRNAGLGGVGVVAAALGAFALGAVSVGALAIGALAIGRLVVGRVRIRRAEFDSLAVRELTVSQLNVARIHVSDSLELPGDSDRVTT